MENSERLKCGVVILNYNDASTTLSLIYLIKEYRSIDYIVVVDNNSSDNSFDKLLSIQSSKCIIVKATTNGGYSYGNNIGAKLLVEKYNVDVVFIANPDVEFRPDLIDDCIYTLHHNHKIAVVSAIMKGISGKPMRMWLKLPSFLNSCLDCSFIGRQINKFIRPTKIDYDRKIMEVDIIPGSFFGIKADVFKDIGYFDENVFLYYEENILGLKIKESGYKTAIITTNTFLHKHSISINKNLKLLNSFKISLISKLYYEEKYKHINSIQKFFLKTLMKYAIFEMSLLLRLRSLINK
jgi:Predicted glycosyltransferases